MKRKWLWSLMGVLLSFACSVQAERRVAFLVGNSAYAGEGELNCPAKDAEDLGRSLQTLGFETIVVTDVTLQEFLDNGVAPFAAALEKEEVDVALFFFSGHGVQYNARNNMCMLETGLPDEEWDDSLVPVELIFDVMESYAKLTITIMDACRNEVVATRSLGGNKGGKSAAVAGMGHMDPPRGGLQAFATAPGTYAKDGPKGGNSIYAKHLINALEATPEKEIRDLLVDVRRNTREETDGFQIPWENSSLEGKFYFKASSGTPVAAAPAVGSVPAMVTAASPRSAIDTMVAELLAGVSAHEPLKIGVKDIRSATPGYPGVSGLSLEVRSWLERALSQYPGAKLVTQQELADFQQAADLREHDLVDGAGRVHLEAADAKVEGHYSLRENGVFLHVSLIRFDGGQMTIANGLLPIAHGFRPSAQRPAPVHATYVPANVQGSQLAMAAAERIRSQLGNQRGIRLAIGTDDGRSAYRAGETLNLWAQASRDSYLVVLAHDKNGDSTVLYPFPEMAHHPLRAGKSTHFLGEDFEIEVIPPYGSDVVQAFAFADRSAADRFLRVSGGLSAYTGDRAAQDEVLSRALAVRRRPAGSASSSPAAVVGGIGEAVLTLTTVAR